MMKSNAITATALLSMVLLGPSLAAAETGSSETALSDLRLDGCKTGWAQAQADCSISGAPFSVAGRRFSSGVGVHAASTWTLPLDAKAEEFRASVGVQDGNPGSVSFVVKGDGKILFESGVMRQGDPAKAVRVPLAGVRELALEVADGGDGMTSDHADWLEPVIIHRGAPLPLLPATPVEPDRPGVPSYQPAKVQWNAESGRVSLVYGGDTILEGTAPGLRVTESRRVLRSGAVEQRITLSGADLHFGAVAEGSGELIAAETRGAAQEKFPIVRTNHGVSDNARNNALYDRRSDWQLEVIAPATRIRPKAQASDARSYVLDASGGEISLIFRPHFYQKHKGISFFEPWTYKVREDSITGWSSWWAYMRNFSQKDCDALLAVWKDKRMSDYGCRFIQIDDCFQDDLREARPVHPSAAQNNGYTCRGPATWLDWRKDLYPDGKEGYVAACRNAGFEPGVWIGNYFTANETIAMHPEWFVRDAKGTPFGAPWASCGIDATNEAAMSTLVRPTYSGIKKAGFTYVKIDLMRHYLYDLLHHNLDYCNSRGATPAQMYRKYLSAAREELGPDTFLLSCWGVLPESVGLADACRIAGDGYGPASMQQYNSWNGIVWRNDPDHCDVYPKFKPAQTGNVAKTDAVTPTNNDTVIRPALASIAGSMLILSDKPEVYRDERNLVGARRSSPVLFSVPGQLYDYDDRHSSTVATMPRESITSGAAPAPCDADQFGAVCPWWLNEIDVPGVGHWNVLHRLNWGEAVAPAKVDFRDLGLEAERDYLVYEFWTGEFLGLKRGGLELPAAQARELRSYSIRALEDHPQIVSTNRHLSQGGVDLLQVKWSGKTLSGRSRVIEGDRYELVVHAPAGFPVDSAQIAGKPGDVRREGQLLRVSFVPESTGVTDWAVVFK